MRVYGDLLRYRDMQREGGPITTPAVAECRALALQLERIAAEGIAARWRRHERLRERTAKWAADGGLELASAAAHRSPSVSCLRAPAGTSGPEIVKRAAARGFVVGGGYGKWKQATFRIGHMGEVGEDDLERLLAVLTFEMTRST